MTGSLLSDMASGVIACTCTSVVERKDETFSGQGREGKKEGGREEGRREEHADVCAYFYSVCA